MSQPPYTGPPYPDEQHEGEPDPGMRHPDTPPWYEPPSYEQPPAYQQQQPAYGEPPSYGEQPPYAPPGYGEQPPYAPPGYGEQPPYAPPAYGDQPPYAPPGYGDQPPYQPPPGFSAPRPPRRKSKALPIVLVSLGIVLVLCVGAGTAIFIAGRGKVKEIVDSAPEAATSAPTGDSTPRSGATTTMTEPKTLGGRPKITDEQFSVLADQLQSSLADVPNATSTVGALYGTPAKRDIVVIAGAAAPIDDPKRELDSTFLGAGIGGLKVTGITSVDPGSLGGVAKCGKAGEQDIDMAMCGWADGGSVGWIVFFSTSVNSAKAEFPKLRAQIEKKAS